MIRKVKIIYYLEESDKRKIQDLLKANEISQRDLAKKFDISPAYLSDILNGKRSLPDNLHVWLNNNVFNIFRDLLGVSK